MRRRRRKGFGWLPDIPDARDHKFRLKKIIRFPTKVDLRPNCPAVQDQGSLGSCTANALVSALEFLEIKHNESFVDYSRLFLYYNERVYIKTVEEDSGAIIRDGIKSLNRKGICQESSWDYKISRFAEQPPKECYTEARTHKTVSYQRLNSLNQMRGCLAEGHPFVFGFAVYDSFYESEQSGAVPMPDFDNEDIIGGHAVLCVGYNDSQEVFLCMNSWGKNWGIDGFFTMPYEYLKDRNLCDDFWVIRF